MRSPAAAQIDYTDDLHPAIRAAVLFLAEDERWFRALMRHRSGSHGWCTEHADQHPCLVYRLAECARALYMARVVPAQRNRGRR